jgi:peptide/nickel transport system ATP-binding protein
MSGTSDIILELRNVGITYAGRTATVSAVSGLNLDVKAGEILGLVGESGSGKSTLGAGILNNLPRSARLHSDAMVFEGRDLRSASAAEWRRLRWRRLSYVPQGAMNALNPVRRIGDQFLDIIRDHEGRTTLARQRTRLETLLASMHLPPTVLDRFPHELSGGMKQRVCIVMAIIFGPRLIIADEPTSALDVVSQRVVLGTLLEARHKVGSAVILIGHDLALQAQVADRIGIMNRGQLVEIGPAKAIFTNPRHPYTKLLIAAVPSIRIKEQMEDFLREGDGAEKPVYPTGPLVEVGQDHLVMMPEAGA